MASLTEAASAKSMGPARGDEVVTAGAPLSDQPNAKARAKRPRIDLDDSIAQARAAMTKAMKDVQEARRVARNERRKKKGCQEGGHPFCRGSRKNRCAETLRFWPLVKWHKHRNRVLGGVLVCRRLSTPEHGDLYPVNMCHGDGRAHLACRERQQRKQLRQRGHSQLRCRCVVRYHLAEASVVFFICPTDRLYLKPTSRTPRRSCFFSACLVAVMSLVRLLRKTSPHVRSLCLLLWLLVSRPCAPGYFGEDHAASGSCMFKRMREPITVMCTGRMLRSHTHMRAAGECFESDQMIAVACMRCLCPHRMLEWNWCMLCTQHT